MSKKTKEEEVDEIKQKSGHGLHLKVANYLESKGWEVVIGQYYIDIATGLSRDLDILATKYFPIADSGTNLRIRFFIECKYVENINVVWFTPKDLKKSQALIADTGLMRGSEEHEMRIANPASYMPLYHHYMENSPVAKLTDKKGQQDIFYQGVNSSVHGMIALRNTNYERFSFDYPVIVFDSFEKIFRATEDNKNIEITENFQRAIDYSYKQEDQLKSKYFIIDIVSFELIDSFLENIEKADVEIMKSKAFSQIKEERFQERMHNINRYSNDDPFNDYGI